MSKTISRLHSAVPAELFAQMRRSAFCWIVILAITAPTILADEQIRRVQEELRKRNLFFGDVNGQTSPELVGALKRYQNRKGFAVTGAIDEETANSLSIQTAVSVPSSPQPAPSVWPDLPVLKSDAARDLPELEKTALRKKAEENPDASPSPAAPAESPSADQSLSPRQVQKLVEDYLRDGETNDVDRQVRYYAFPVEYFDHGRVDRAFVTKDTKNYLKRWPERKYTLTDPVSFVAGTKDGETVVEFPITFHVKNQHHSASGKTKNFWTIKPEAGELKIVAIREVRMLD